ncbi:GH36-type glycosyl hydrolase domain-containing protein [Virgibacillus necropolis]|nr:glycosyl hydrolase family 65 protein [Virgibacillus necropolis]
MNKFFKQAGNVNFTFLNSGDIYEITHKNSLINQWMSNPLDGSLNNIYLRLHQASGIKVVPLLGVHSTSTLSVTDSYVKWQGSTEGIAYQVTFHPTEKGIWFWDIILNGNDVEVDVIYGQDLGLADKGAVRSNEAYMSQYMDHTVFEDEKRGFVVCTRQNQPQQEGFPYIQQGSLGKAIGYSTDGFQFFGLSYKTTNTPEVLKKPTLANETYQYEFAYTALQSERVKLAGQQQFVFYGLFKENHPNATTALDYENEIYDAWQQLEKNEAIEHSVERVYLSSAIGNPLQTVEMTEEEIDGYFPDRQLGERDQASLLSFFTRTYEHVILKKKEELVERPHGHILMSGQNENVQEDTLSTTSYMYGLFNSQLVVGNVNMNKMITNARNPLNIMKTSGQRIYVEIDGIYHLLTMPSMFELGFNYARWYYKTESELFIITNFTTVDSPEVQLDVRSTSGKAYAYLISNQVTMNNNEYEVPFRMKNEGNIVSISADSASNSGNTYPDLTYRLQVTGTEMTVEDERRFASNIESGAASLIVLSLDSTSEWTMIIQGLLYNEVKPLVKRDVEHEVERYRDYYRNVTGGFRLTQQEGTSEDLEKVNAITWWYTHNMLVHFSSPHGLEQYGGAAWGTRDVSQGPTEYFMATQNYRSVREIIKTIFSHQYKETGSWPQWFMFDKFTHVQQTESHGDIIVWPLKVIAEYIEATNDYAILQERVPYTDQNNFAFTAETVTILEHAKKEVAYIKEHFLHDTFLSSYDDGDWDDTLQPANEQLKKYMVSSWTVALTYQVLRKLATVLTDVDEKEAAALHDLASGIKQDFNTYILQSDVIPGFIYMKDLNDVELMLHPSDTKTGIDYRLLPMQESMISELFTPEQAEHHYRLIKKHLTFPDGVRLMNRPANYAGGVSTHFKRAEQATNFGREIGLQYVHAHIRYVEAMAKLGKTDEVWNGLSVINPISIQNVVPNAEIRQSNTYFSSSDGKFNTRYEAEEHFDKLRTGAVPVKGGWRIYSSGPGIYMNQLISNALGIRTHAGNLVIDPVLPEKMDGLRFDFTFMEHPVTFIYHLNQATKQVVVNGNVVETESVANPYRNGGFIVERDELKKQLTTVKNTVEVYL